MRDGPMDLELGIELTPATSKADLDPIAELAERAEAGGLDLVVVAPALEEARDALEGLDPWTTATWVAGSTTRIRVGAPADASTPDTNGPGKPYPAVVAKARQSLDLLSGGRLLARDRGWVVAPAEAGVDELGSLAQAGLPVVVPVRTVEDVDRLTTLVSGRATGGRWRSPAVRARRRQGIDYDGVPESLRDTAVEPGDPEHRAVSSTYLRGGSPGLVLRPTTEDQVTDAVDFARRHRRLPLGVRSGAHGVSGRSTNDGGLVIDVGALNHIEILDPARRLVRVGPGATWKQVAAALDPHDWALGSGDYGGVGVGGLATAGGIGLLSRKYGLTIDHLRAVDLVLADGTPVRATEHDRPDLFWAVRGAGANFGVATSFEFEVNELREVGWAKLVLVSADLEETLVRFGELASSAPRDTTVFLVTGRPHQADSVVQLYAVVDSGDPDVIVERLTPFALLGSLAEQQVVLTRYAHVMAQAPDVGSAGHRGQGEPVSRSAFLPALSAEFVHDAAELLRSGLVHFLQLRTMGGAIADLPAEATAFSRREAAFQLTVMGADHARLDPAFDALAPHFRGLYLSFETDLRPERLDDAFPPPVLERLREAKGRYDPENLFRDNFNIDPRTALGPGPRAGGPTRSMR